jgi:hypothetical protein
MIEFLRKAYGIDRVAIVDTDCHHGDGTQDIYWHDPDTLFISIHQDGRTLYPGSGFLSEMGGPNAIGATVNIPLPPYTSDDGFLYAIERLVLPILSDFKPQLIVNSAGQDNHYSDPITNMNFSAKGYARLTSLLKPDIAVLEGGYSIEGALPYVNLGIILAMAGLDYSRVKEPSFDAQKIRQKQDVTDWIKKTGDKVLETWQQRADIAGSIRAKAGCNRRRRGIFYDTDNIHETQDETIVLCDHCAGALKIDSASDQGQHILAVHIPRKACPDCLHQGLEWYESADPKQFDRIYLQDRTQDKYINKASLA